MSNDVSFLNDSEDQNYNPTTKHNIFKRVGISAFTSLQCQLKMLNIMIHRLHGYPG